MYCTNNDLKKESEINYEEWQPLIVNRQILSLIVPEPSEFAKAYARQIDIQQIFKLEALRTDPLGRAQRDNKQENLKELPSVRLVYDNGIQYMGIYQALIEEEMIMDKMQKESFSQSGIKVEWGLSLRNKRTATFVFPSSEELGPSW